MMIVFTEQQNLKMILVMSLILMSLILLFLNNSLDGKTSIDKALVEQANLELLIKLFDNEIIGKFLLRQ